MRILLEFESEMNQILRRFGLEVFGIGSLSLLVINNLPFLMYPLGILGFSFTYFVIKYSYKIVEIIRIFDFDTSFKTKENSVVKWGNSVIITIEGKHVIVPYDKGIMRKYTGKRVFLIKNDGSRKEIIPYPGIPFISTATDLNIERIEIVSENDE